MGFSRFSNCLFALAVEVAIAIVCDRNACVFYTILCPKKLARFS
jgi:hypothetical protein